MPAHEAKPKGLLKPVELDILGGLTGRGKLTYLDEPERITWRVEPLIASHMSWLMAGAATKPHH